MNPQDSRTAIQIFFERKPLIAREGQTIAGALLSHGIRVFRHTRQGERPRGLFCGIGVCYDCLVVVDGVPNVRACMTPVRRGMRIERQHVLTEESHDE